MCKQKTVRKLTDQHRLHIVHWLAEYIPQPEIVKRVEKQFNIKISQGAVAYYAPPTIPEKWQKEFERHRKAYLADMDDIALSHRKIRVKELVKLYNEIEWHKDRVLAAGNTPIKDENGKPIIIDSKDIATAARLLKQIGEELNQYKNRHEITGKDGQPIETAAYQEVVVYLPDNGRSAENQTELGAGYDTEENEDN